MSAGTRMVGGKHYMQMQVQPWDVVDSWSQEQRIGFYRGNAIKYLMRAGTKDATRQEVLKAQHYVEKLLEIVGDT